MAKLYASEAANRIAYRAVQIHGGTGYVHESRVEQLARDAALLRTRSGRAATIAAADAIVAALAVGQADPIVLTSDPDDLAALVADHPASVTIARA